MQLLNNQESIKNNQQYPIYGKVEWAMLTRFDIDLIDRFPLVSVCANCRSWLKQSDSSSTLECTIQHDASSFCDKCVQLVKSEKIFWVRACINDSTGSVECKVNTKVCTELLGFNPEDFSLFSVSERSELKWKVLLESFQVYFSVFKTRTGKTALRLLALDSDITELL